VSMYAVPTVAPEKRDHMERRVYLHPGNLWVDPAPAVVTTVLGSCVSVCLWDPRTALGGVNHFILPQGGTAASARYGNHALSMLLERVLRIGAERETLLACVFGGASIIPGDGNGPRLGSRNVMEAFDFLGRNEIAVLRHDVEGQQGRKLTFRTTDGTTLIRKL
jgi:chemotaxis protein CheD